METTNEKYVRVIADLTRTRFGMERSVVKLLKRYCDAEGVEKSTLSIIAGEHQRQYVAPEFDGATIIVLSGVDVRQTIMGLVRAVKEDGLIRLMSYGRDVLELEREDRRIRALSFGRYRQASRPLAEKPRVDVAGAPAATPTDSSIVAAPQDVVVAEQTTPAVTEPKKPVYPSEIFQAILIRRNLGPFPDHRALVYDAIEGLVSSNVRLRVSELLKRAIADARLAATERNKVAGREPVADSRLWAGIARFAEQLVLEANVLIGPDGEMLGTDWKSRSLQVHDLAPLWRAKCDGLLILGLVDDDVKITSADAKNVARAIYHSSSEASETRVSDAVVHLLEREILVETPDGLKRVPPPQEGRIAPRLVS